MNRKIFVKIIDGNMLTVLYLVVLPTVQTLVLDEQTSAQNSGDALLIMLAEEKQLRMQLANQVQALEKRVESVQSTMSDCECEGRPTGSPAFMAALSNDLVHCSKYQPIVFDVVKLNAGSAYDNKHGIFTAPLAGTYFLSTTLTVISGYAYHTAFVKNNATNEIGFLFADPVTMWEQRSTTVLTHLDAGDEIWMVCVTDSRIEGDHNHGWEGADDYLSHMSGFLLSAD